VQYVGTTSGPLNGQDLAVQPGAIRDKESKPVGKEQTMKRWPNAQRKRVADPSRPSLDARRGHGESFRTSL
jgi:hypothetical protein